MAGTTSGSARLNLCGIRLSVEPARMAAGGLLLAAAVAHAILLVWPH